MFTNARVHDGAFNGCDEQHHKQEKGRVAMKLVCSFVFVVFFLVSCSHTTPPAPTVDPAATIQEAVQATMVAQQPGIATQVARQVQATVQAIETRQSPPTPMPFPTPTAPIDPPPIPLSRCTPSRNPNETNLTHAQLPDCSAGYDTHRAQITEFTSTAGNVIKVAGVVFPFAQPEIAGPIKVISVAGLFAQCADEKEITSWEVYTAKTDAAQAGVVLVISHKRLTDPAILTACTLRSIESLRPTPTPQPAPIFSPCSGTLSYTTKDDTYYVSYAATRTVTCADFRGGFPSG
jgi:hypothetical protein